MKISIGGFLQHSLTKRDYFPIQKNPTMEQVNSCLNAVEKEFGALVMESQISDESDSVELILYAEDGLYMMILTEPLSDGDLSVRTYLNADAPNELINVFGEPYNAKTTFNDFQIARKAFFEFQMTGNVSRELLDD